MVASTSRPRPGPSAADPEAIAAAEIMWSRSRRSCGACAYYHGTHAYLRLAGFAGNSMASTIPWDVMNDLLAAGARRVLLAGAGDLGNARRIIALLGPREDAALRIHDRCETPLSAIRESGLGRDPRVDCFRSDLTGDPRPLRADIAFADRILGYMEPAAQQRFVANMAHALSPGGTLLLVDAVDGQASQDTPQEFTASILRRLAERGVELPSPRVDFVAALERYGEARSSFQANIPSAAGIVTLMRNAGLMSVVEHELSWSGSSGGAAATKTRGRRLLFVARRD